MSKIISIGTALPPYCHRQKDILGFMLNAYQPEAEDRRKISLLYERSGIESRYSVIPDFSRQKHEYAFFPQSEDLEPFPALKQRMQVYHQHATLLSNKAIQKAVGNFFSLSEITALITVSCTGMSAPGLDISIMQSLELDPGIQRSSVNFMGCYAAIHALKMADNICKSDRQAKVLVVCTELCTIHFQKDCDMDSITSALLFADGAAAVVVTADSCPFPGLFIKSFYSHVALQGRDDMAWQLSEKGFLMHLSSYIPHLLKNGIASLLSNALEVSGDRKENITDWAIHPGGRKILETISAELRLHDQALSDSFDVLRQFGNMSSPTILFVLKNIMDRLEGQKGTIFTAAFGPGLTMETLILEQ